MDSQAPKPDEHLRKYREYLVAAEQKSQEEYDKALLSLSGGALGITFAFLKDIVGANPVSYKFLLLTAWVSWGGSIGLTLFSHLTGTWAFRKAIEKNDIEIRRICGEEGLEEIGSEDIGGKAARMTRSMNFVSGLLFLIGVILITVFVTFNLGAINMQDKNNPLPSPVPSPNKPNIGYSEHGITPTPPPPPPSQTPAPPPNPPASSGKK